VVADPDRLATLVPALSGVSVVCWLMGTAEGAPEVHGLRLQTLLEHLVDTPVRGLVYEEAGSVDESLLQRGAQIVRTAAQTWHIRGEVVTADPADRDAWLEAMKEAVRRGAFEGVMRNYRGELAECTTANLFIVKRGAALTPPLDAGLLAGLTREFLFEVGADAGIPVREQVLKDEDLFGADEAFLTSTTREVVPIVRVDQRIIGSGAPGPVTKALLAGFRKRAHAMHPLSVAGTGTPDS